MAKATCHLTALGDSKVQGFIAFTQKTEDTPTAIIGEIIGLTPGPHAISIQIFGDLSQGFASMGGHFNPFGRNHGEPGDEERHVGSLGNINADVEGRAKFAIEDKLVKLIGPYVRFAFRFARPPNKCTARARGPGTVLCCLAFACLCSGGCFPFAPG
jgi:Cu-Zn family superoxide dismutase